MTSKNLARLVGSPGSRNHARRREGRRTYHVDFGLEDFAAAGRSARGEGRSCL